MNILLEGKKEIIEKVKKKHPNDIEFIDRMFSIDPTSQGKYAKWIGDYLELSLQFKDYDNIENMIRKIIIPFEKNYKRIDDEIIYFFKEKLLRDVYPLEGKRLKDFEKIKKNPKDINAYSKPYYILVMLLVLSENKARSEKERMAKKDVDKVFDSSDFLVVRPLSYEASCYYGKQTKWCTASRDTSSNYEKYSKNGVLYYFINKKRPNEKVALYMEKDGKRLNKYVYDSFDNEKGIHYLYDEFPELSSVINELTEQSPLIELLMLYKSGKDNSSKILNSENVVNFIPNEKNRGESIIQIGFEDFDDYIKTIDLDDDDKWFLGMVNSTYSDYDFYSMDGDDEWNGGYILRYFNNEELELLREIIKIILPVYANTDFSDDKINSEICETLNEMFDYEIGSIISDYQIEMNRITRIGVERQVEDDLCNFFESYGIKKSEDYDCYERYETTVDNLIKLYEEYQPKNKTIKSLLLAMSEDNAPGGWMYNTFEMIEWSEFNSEGFNRDVNWNLEKIKDKVEENENFNEYIDIFNEINKNYTIDKWYNLPRNKDASFRITGIDIDDLTIRVSISNNFKISNYVLNNLDEFYSLLYNYKLFDDN